MNVSKQMSIKNQLLARWPAMSHTRAALAEVAKELGATYGFLRYVLQAEGLTPVAWLDYKDVPESVKAKIVELRKAGRTNSEIMRQLGVTAHQVYLTAKRADLLHFESKRSSPMPEATVEAIVKARDAGYTYPAITGITGATEYQIWTVLNRHGRTHGKVPTMSDDDRAALLVLLKPLLLDRSLTYRDIAAQAGVSVYYVEWAARKLGCLRRSAKADAAAAASQAQPEPVTTWRVGAVASAGSSASTLVDVESTPTTLTVKPAAPVPPARAPAPQSRWAPVKVATVKLVHKTMDGLEMKVDINAILGDTDNPAAVRQYSVVDKKLMGWAGAVGIGTHVSAQEAALHAASCKNDPYRLFSVNSNAWELQPV